MTRVARLIHLNGAPGVGKSTLARRYAEEHPGVLLCEIDVLRTMVAGWQDDPVEAGVRIRSVALAAITTYLSDGGDVVCPQLASGDQVARFARAARGGGATYVHSLLTAPPEEVVRRFRTRGDDHPWAGTVHRIVEEAGGDEALRGWVARLEELDAVRIPCPDPDTAYDALLAVVGES